MKALFLRVFVETSNGGYYSPIIDDCYVALPIPETTKILDPGVVGKIIADIKNLRTRGVTALLYETGARISEIPALRRRHVIETPAGYYKLVIEDPKNREFRMIYVNRHANLLRTYLQTIRGGPEDPLFPSPLDPKRPISPYNIEKTFKKLSQKVRG